jgi:hypothetical protein
VTTGNGFLIEQSATSTLQVMYFQLNNDGTQLWTIGTATAGANGGYSGQLIEPVGTQFGAAFNSSQIDKSRQWQWVLSNVACASATAFQAPLFQSGPGMNFALQRLTTPASVPACSP